MKKLLLAIALLLLPSAALAQCNGVFPNNTACGNISGASNTPRPIPLTSFPANAPGGTTGQIQTNAGGGLFGGFTMGGDCTTNTSTGAITCTSLDGVPVNPTSSSANDVLAYNGTSYVHTAIITLLNAVCSLSPTTCNSFFGYMMPEWYGALHNGSADDAAPIRAALSALNSIGQGELRLSCVIYNIATRGANGAMLNNYTQVDIVGCGGSSVMRLANGIITSVGSFTHFMLPTSSNIAQAINHAQYRNFVIDMNAANNDCSGTCYSSNEVLGAFYGDDILVDGVGIISNPGSQGFSFGSTFAAFPTISDVRIVNSYLINFCDAINAACTDSSAIWIHAANGVIANNTIQDCGPTKGTGIELHGFNVTASANQIFSCNAGIVMSSDTGSVATNSNGLIAIGNNIQAANIGVSIQIITGTTSLDYMIANNNIGLNSAVSSVVSGIDASSVISSTATTGILNITGNTITSALATTLANASFGIGVQYWASANIANNVISNIAGPGVLFPGGTNPSASIYNVTDNIIQDVGRFTPGGSSASGIEFIAGTNPARIINVHGNSIANTNTIYATTGINGAMNTNGGLIYGNSINNITTPITWSGTGIGVGTTCGSVTAASVTSVNGIITHC